MDTPTLVYRSPGSHFAHAGATYDYAPAVGAQELEAKLAAGWHPTLEAAVAAGKKPTVKTSPIPGEKAIPDDNAPPTRAELEAKANEMGLQFDGRISDSKLRKLVESA